MTYILAFIISLYALLSLISLCHSLLFVPPLFKEFLDKRSTGVILCFKWFLLLWVGLLVEVIGVIISPIVVLFANHNTGRLPYGFRWMETHDAILPGYPLEQDFHLPYPSTWWGYYWQSLCWLNRNRVYRFTTEFMGVLCNKDVARLHVGDYNISDEPPVKLGSFIEVSPNCFEIQKVFNLFGRVWEWRIGYKLAWTQGKTAYAQHVLRLRSGSKITKV